MAIFDIFKNLFKEKPSITTSELEKLLAEKRIELIDVRTPIEYNNGHIRQSRNLPLDKINYYRGDKDKDIYVICASGMRSSRASSYLRKMGYNAINVKGGMSSWTGEIVK